MRRLLVCVAFVVALVAGAIAPAGAADTVLHQFVWNSSGIAHDSGFVSASGHDLTYPAGHLLGHRDTWDADYLSNSGATEWYGPKTSIVDAAQSYRFCFDYVAPTTLAATVRFDVTNSSPANIMWTDDRYIPPVPRLSDGSYLLHVLCVDLNLFGTFTKIQMRMRTLVVGVNDTVFMYKSTYQGSNPL